MYGLTMNLYGHRVCFKPAPTAFEALHLIGQPGSFEPALLGGRVARVFQAVAGQLIRQHGLDACMGLFSQWRIGCPGADGPLADLQVVAAHADVVGQRA